MIFLFNVIPTGINVIPTGRSEWRDLRFIRLSDVVRSFDFAQDDSEWRDLPIE